jgi:molybdopterin/thiamine biosynthesis adenylyltransferase
MREQVEAAAERLRGPGGVEWRVLSPVGVAEIARACDRAPWEVEIEALEAKVVPLHYLRNLARFDFEGQIRLLRTATGVVGSGLAVETCLKRLAAAGVGRLFQLVPEASDAGEGSGDRAAREVAGANASVSFAVRSFSLRHGDPTASLRDLEIVAACLEEAAEEFLLQAACQRLRIPLICAGLMEGQGQILTLFPGDTTLARVYRGEHPHLEKTRPGSSRLGGALARAVGTWMSDQLIAARLDTEDLLRGKLLFGDLETGRLETIDL